MKPMLLLACIALTTVAASRLYADETGPLKTCQNTLAIEWVLPGEFDHALKFAEQKQRLIMIKGIAFGIDHVGAKNATKGCW